MLIFIFSLYSRCGGVGAVLLICPVPWIARDCRGILARLVLVHVSLEDKKEIVVLAQVREEGQAALHEVHENADEFAERWLSCHGWDCWGESLQDLCFSYGRDG